MKQYAFRLFPRSIFARPWKVSVPVPHLIAGSISALIVSFYFGGVLAPYTGMLNGLLISSTAAIAIFCGTVALTVPLGEIGGKVGFRKVSFRELLLCLGALLIILAGSSILTAFWQQILEYFRIPFEKEQGRLILGEVVITQSMEIILANGTL